MGGVKGKLGASASSASRDSRSSRIRRNRIQVSDLDRDAFDFDRGRGRWAGGRFGPWFWRWWRNEVRAEQGRRAGVIDDAEHELAALLVNARAPSDHLVEQNRRMDVAEENN